jgi:hypothetical protein
VGFTIGASRLPEIEGKANAPLEKFFNILQETFGLMVIKTHLKNQHDVCHGTLAIWREKWAIQELFATFAMKDRGEMRQHPKKGWT